MTDVTMKRIDHSSETPEYSALSRTFAAIAKYAKVTRPVVAIPIDRIRAPAP